MKITIVTDVVLYEYQNHYFLSSAFGSILKRYSAFFGKVNLCSRLTKKEPPQKYICVDDCIAQTVGINSFLKPMTSLKKKQVKNMFSNSDLIVLRLGSIIACKVYRLIKKLKKSYFTEIMSDVWDGYWNHSFKGKLIAPYMFFKTKTMTKNADYALYVTDSFLQKRYPCKRESIGVSNVQIELANTALAYRLEKIANMTKSVTVMTTAAVDVKYKGQQYVIRAIAKLNQKGIRVNYMLIGGGNQNYLKAIAKKYGVLDQVYFVGMLSHTEVFEYLDQADIYIQPSLQEGLPRSMIEAMSRGCPCIGARTAGIPELIDKEYIVRRKNVSDIVDKILMISNSSLETRQAIAIRNFEKSKDFLPEILDARRNSFYQNIFNNIEGKNRANK